jgi:hypothetical protein
VKHHDAGLASLPPFIFRSHSLFYLDCDNVIIFRIYEDRFLWNVR